MASCFTVARCSGVRGFIKKDNSPAYNLSLALDDGANITVMVNGPCPSFSFGTLLSVGFDLIVFQSKVNGIKVVSVEEAKK